MHGSWNTLKQNFSSHNRIGKDSRLLGTYAVRSG